MRHIDFSLRDDVTGASRLLKPSVRKYVEKWLLQRASCRLHPAWTDLGELFWPRWVRRGSCGEDDAALTDVRPLHRRRHGRRRPTPSCSWPPGMRCVPEASQTIKLLRWQCSASSRRRREDDAGEGRGGRIRLKSSRRRRRGRGRRSRNQATTSKYSGGSAGSEWQWRCRWKKVPYAVTIACFCSCWHVLQTNAFGVDEQKPTVVASLPSVSYMTGTSTAANTCDWQTLDGHFYLAFSRAHVSIIIISIIIIIIFRSASTKVHVWTEMHYDFRVQLYF